MSQGDWNGTGAHTNYSTESMRNPGGMDAIMAAIEKLSKTHAEHISQVGAGLGSRVHAHGWLFAAGGACRYSC